MRAIEWFGAVVILAAAGTTAWLIDQRPEPTPVSFFQGRTRTPEEKERLALLAELQNARVNELRAAQARREIADAENLEAIPAWIRNTECRGGVLLRKTQNGWESVTEDGKALPCKSYKTLANGSHVEVPT